MIAVKGIGHINSRLYAGLPVPPYKPIQHHHQGGASRQAYKIEPGHPANSKACRRGPNPSRPGNAITARHRPGPWPLNNRNGYYLYAKLQIPNYRKNPMDRPGDCRQLVGLQATGDPNDATENFGFGAFINIPPLIFQIVADNSPFGIAL